MDSLYGQQLYIGTSPVTITGERYGRVYYVEGHHKLGNIDSVQFRKVAHRLSIDYDDDREREVLAIHSLTTLSARDAFAAPETTRTNTSAAPAPTLPGPDVAAEERPGSSTHGGDPGQLLFAADLWNAAGAVRNYARMRDGSYRQTWTKLADKLDAAAQTLHDAHK
jgi:hypothetical protein